MEEQGIAVEQNALIPDTGVATGSNATEAVTSGPDATDAGSSGQQQEPVESSFPKPAIDEITRLRSRSRNEEQARIRAEVERDMLRRQLAEKEKPAVRNEPRPEDFADQDQYRRAQNRHEVETEVANVLAKERQKQQQETMLRTFNQAETQAAEKYADYLDVTRDPAINQVVTPVMANAILGSDIGPDLHYYLAKNRTELLSIAQMEPVAAVRAIGRIEAKLTLGATQPAQGGKPPPPFKPVAGNSKVDVPIEKLSMDEYAAKWEADRAAGRI